MNDRLLFELADRLQHRFYGKYRGVVVDVDAATMRIKATVPAVLGETTTGWCMPCVPYAGDQVGFFFLPDTGAGVWIEFEGGDVSYPIWTGCYWHQNEVPSDASATTRGIVTASPHKILFDDQGGSVTIEDSNNGSIVFDSSGVTTSRGSETVAVGDSSVSINNGALEVM